MSIPLISPDAQLYSFSLAAAPPSAWLRPAQALTGRTGVCWLGSHLEARGRTAACGRRGCRCSWRPPCPSPRHAVTRGLLSTRLCHQPRKLSACGAGSWIRPTPHKVGDARNGPGGATSSHTRALEPRPGHRNEPV